MRGRRGWDRVGYLFRACVGRARTATGHCGGGAGPDRVAAMPAPPSPSTTPRSRLATLLVGLLLSVLAWPAFALGLGQVEVRSRAGEPLLAEIPIISSDPSELEYLEARLASPETFRRIGLDPPTGLVSDLRFSIALDARGRPVVRITTEQPVEQPVLNFLVEVEWGQGRLVREYSALVATPDTVAAPAQPPIQAPQAAPSNVIERLPDAAPPTEDATAAGEPADTPASDADTVATSAEPVQAEPAPPPRAQAPAPVARAPAQAPAPGGEFGPVQRGQTLSEIAASLAAGSGYSLNQVMLALLRSNPEAFIGGNINLIRQGAVLRIPPSDAWSETSVAEANAIVREHVARWREMRRPVPQPDAVAAGEAAPAGQTGDARSGASASSAPRVADARLEIVPAAAEGAGGTSTQTGTAAGGEGDMLQQQELVQTRETLAAREAELEELKSRLAELEQLQQQQAQLIQMKDSELAAAQQRLAESNARSPEAGALPWLWLGIGLVAAVLLAAWLLSRRPRPAPARKGVPGFAAAPAGAREPTVKPAGKAPVAPAPGPVPPEPEPEPAPPPAPQKAPTWTAPPAAATGASPTWHVGGGARTEAPSGAEVVPLNAGPAGQDRIELARAYLDLGDTDTARSLLQEVADFGDPGPRDEALQLLRELA